MVVVHEVGEPQCQALNLSDAQRCIAEATAHDGLFCRFHARQCFGLYMGYKRRNAELDALANQEPVCLGGSKTPLASWTFEGIVSEEQLREVHEYLFRQYVLLGKVISARKLHHKHFFPLDMDYGHKAYLDKLVSTRHSVLKALENLERRTAELLYEKEKWFSWVRQVQDDEDHNRDKEQKKVKLEAALFRRHWREVEARLATTREKEEKKRQEAYLDEAWKERVAAGPDTDGDASWDPIEDLFEDDRGRYLDLIRNFLWMEAPPALAAEVAEDEEKAAAEAGGPPPAAGSTGEQPEKVTVATEEPAAAQGVGEQAASGQAKKPRKRGGKKKSNKTGQSIPDIAKIESRDDIRKRLREGIEKDYSHVNGPMIVGTAHNPAELLDRTAPVKDEDISELIADITEIKMLLFCRQIMSHSALLPAALRANSVGEFLSDPSLADSDLRDLCLRVEQPTLQALRDACADFARGDEPDDNDEEEQDGDKVDLRPAADYIRQHLRYDDLAPDFLIRALNSLYRGPKPSQKQLLDAVSDDNGPENKKMKVRLCGRNIWNHASQGSMARAGWLHFSIMAKDCSFQEAIGLCRNWDEFFELNILALWQYFPASKWTGWSGSYLTEELTQLGFVPFHMDFSARENTTYTHLDSLSRKTLRRQQTIVERRNVVCAHMKRNDPVTRRFIQYAAMLPGELLILVRDGRDGRIIVAPDKEHRWIVRRRRGVTAVGRNSRDDNWDTVFDVGPLFFSLAEVSRQWHFGFSSYYEVYVWDFAPGKTPMTMYHHIRGMLCKARRIKGNRGKYAHMKQTMETLTREQDTKRVRQIKPGEDALSLYDELSGPNATFWIKTTNLAEAIQTTEDIAPGSSPYMYYNDTDVAEDAILFEEELVKGYPEDMPFVEIKNPIRHLEASHLPLSIMNRVIKDMENSMPPELERAFGFQKRLGGSDNQESPDPTSPPELQSYDPGSDQFPYSVPPIWRQAHGEITSAVWDSERASLLDRLGFSSAELELTDDDVNGMSGTQEIMERDRAYVYKDSFHLGDLEPGAQERYKESMKLIVGVQKYESPRPQDHLDWAWFCMELLGWLNLELYYDEYNPEVMSPWPHRYIVQDMVQAFMTMGLFFPGVPETSIIQEYLGSEEGKGFKASKLFDPASRCAKRPDVRTRTSTSYRPETFWNDWVKLYEGDKHYLDWYPWDWSMAVKPIIAKLYKAGMIGPAAREAHPDLVPGNATASTEPHRPGQLDLFIKFSNAGKFWEGVPPTFVDYKDWPQLLPAARAFASKCKASNNKTARFSLLRLWSAPHFYPLMMMLPRRPSASFIDPVGRVWEWKFIPKDMALSEWSIHNTIMLRLGYLREQMMGLGLGFQTPADKARGRLFADVLYSGQDKWRHGQCDLDERVVQRGDLIMVMGEDEKDLLRWCTVVTFALQTKPWLREVDLWKSFVNVDLEFLEGLDEFWLD
ncbi:hypothetical protein C8A00DRAFT_19662 [Chaetomidium leptoderma]|uniref:Uncharacterized protein n=1 Tax=Chaetomidium leptoderma TaxID=669021 RepID=A0AAN6VBT2_9PEZI|nr:hypothetical protein C8A00DRAFT_19662 [Chaetomidium leptoderma]